MLSLVIFLVHGFRQEGSRGSNGSSVGLVTRGCGFESQLRQELSMTEVRPLSKAPNLQMLPERRCVGCPLLQVCAFGWVKCREHISLLVILCIIVYVTNIAHLSLIIRSVVGSSLCLSSTSINFAYAHFVQMLGHVFTSTSDRQRLVLTDLDICMCWCILCLVQFVLLLFASWIKAVTLFPSVSAGLYKYIWSCCWRLRHLPMHTKE